MVFFEEREGKSNVLMQWLQRLCVAFGPILPSVNLALPPVG